MLRLQNIHKQFGSTPVLGSIDLFVAEGEIVVLLGPSGCGKTTLLRIIAGLESADAGTVTFAGKPLTVVPVHQRQFGFVFQNYALFPHKNVFDNVAFGLRMQKRPAPELKARVAAVLQLVGLTAFVDRPVYALSGGEQQRVALARSLAPNPRLLLLDEPLGALDRALRERLMLELRQILKESAGVTAVYVTHDQAEAFAIADRIVVMGQDSQGNGRVEQVGPPSEVYHRPRTPMVARFLGMDNIIAGLALGSDPRIINTALGELSLAEPVADKSEVPFSLLIRPDAGQLGPGHTGVNRINGRLQAVSFRGQYQHIELMVPGIDFPLKLTFDSAAILPEVGTMLACELDPTAILPLEAA